MRIDLSLLPGGYEHAIELEQQVNRFNEGYFIDGTRMDLVSTRQFSYGVAGYPEKHDESPNPDEDMKWLKAKVDAGADYIVTQMFFDNEKFFSFVDRCRAAGITVPIVPGLKPISKASQLTLLPRVFHVDIPDMLVREIVKCKDDSQVKQVRDRLVYSSIARIESEGSTQYSLLFAYGGR